MEEERPPEVSELIYKCADSIKTAATDTDKFAGLFVASQALKNIKNESVTRASKLVVLDSIGNRFLVRLLNSKDSPVYDTFQSVALSILNAFVSEKELSVHPTVLAAVQPVVGVIVERSEPREILDEAFDFITAVALTDEGRVTLEKCNAFERILEAFVERSLTDRDLSLIGTMVSSCTKIDYKLFNVLLNKVVLAMCDNKTQRKFELCLIINTFLVNCNRGGLVLSVKASEDWPKRVRKAVSSILSSRLGENQRNPTLILASTMLEIFGTDWILSPSDMDKPFFLLLTHLSAVEVRMQLEDRTLDVILKNADLVIACFVILEISLSYASTDCSVLTDDETGQLLRVGQESLVSVVHTFKYIGMKSKSDQDTFKLALARVIVAWLAHEANSRLPEVLDILSPLIEMASDSFYTYQSCLDSGNTTEKPVDLMRLLLPGLCHVTAESTGQKIIEDVRAKNVLMDCFKFHWRSTTGIDHEEEQEDSETALITLCNIFLNLYTQVETTDNDFHLTLLRFINSNVRDYRSSSLLLKGHLIVLGLTLVRQSPEANRFSCLETFFQDSIEFLSGTFALQGPNSIVNPSYQVSAQLFELLALGLTVLCSLLPSIPELNVLLSNSSWVKVVIDSLHAQNLDDAPPDFVFLVENTILSFLQCRVIPQESLRDSETLAACQRHNMKRLGGYLFPNEFPT